MRETHKAASDGTPIRVDASPRDPMGNPEAVPQTPILEKYKRPEDCKGIDILRAIHSFDPCMPCTTHMRTGSSVISREVVTCACGADGGFPPRSGGGIEPSKRRAAPRCRF